LFTKVLLAADGSGPSLRAAEYAVKLRRLNPGLKVTVLTVCPPMLPLGRGAVFAYAELIEAAEQYMAEIGEKYKELLAGAGIKAEIRRAFGDPGETIVREAEEGGHDLILMGTRGVSNLAGFILGSVAHKVVNLARIPVLLVK